MFGRPLTVWVSFLLTTLFLLGVELFFLTDILRAIEATHDYDSFAYNKGRIMVEGILLIYLWATAGGFLAGRRWGKWFVVLFFFLLEGFIVQGQLHPSDVKDTRAENITIILQIIMGLLIGRLLLSQKVNSYFRQSPQPTGSV